ncbi:hypothetical protein PMI07_006512 [Rhizobium sp. CF080]|nr:hypothetical protein PMI07_006512 [Rhizobium sp. CF080]
MEAIAANVRADHHETFSHWNIVACAYLPRLSQEHTLSAFFLHRTTRRDARGPRTVTVGRNPSWSPLQVARRFKTVKSCQLQGGCPSWKQTKKRQRRQIPPAETATKPQRHPAQTARWRAVDRSASPSGGLAPVGWPRRLLHGSDDGTAPSLRAGIATRCAAVVRPAWRRIDPANSRPSQGACYRAANSFQASRATITCSTAGRFPPAAIPLANPAAARPRPNRAHRPADPFPGPEPGRASLPVQRPLLSGPAQHRWRQTRRLAGWRRHHRPQLPAPTDAGSGSGLSAPAAPSGTDASAAAVGEGCADRHGSAPSREAARLDAVRLSKRRAMVSSCVGVWISRVAPWRTASGSLDERTGTRYATCRQPERPSLRPGSDYQNCQWTVQDLSPIDCS